MDAIVEVLLQVQFKKPFKPKVKFIPIVGVCRKIECHFNVGEALLDHIAFHIFATITFKVLSHKTQHLLLPGINRFYLIQSTFEISKGMSVERLQCSIEI